MQSDPHPLRFLTRDEGLKVGAQTLCRRAQSDPHPLRTLPSFAADLEALADGLLPGRRFFLAGASGGGPYALAAAVRMRSRVRGVLLISPASHPGAPVVFRVLGI